MAVFVVQWCVLSVVCMITDSLLLLFLLKGWSAFPIKLTDKKTFCFRNIYSMYSEIPMPSRNEQKMWFFIFFLNFTLVVLLPHRDSFYRSGEKMSKCKTLLMFNNKGDIFSKRTWWYFRTSGEEKGVLKLFEFNNCIIF